MIRFKGRWWNFIEAILIVAICTFLAWVMFPVFAPANLIMLYLVGVVIVAGRCGRAPSILASVLSVALFDFFFVPPYLTFAVSDTQYVITFGVMLMVAITISTLTIRIQQQVETARNRESRTAQLYAMSRAFADERGPLQIVNVASQQISTLFDCTAIIAFPDSKGNMVAHNAELPSLTAYEEAVAHWVYTHTQVAGLSTATLPAAKGLYLPLLGSQATIGVLAVFPAHANRLGDPDQRDFLETVAHQIALAVERARLQEEAEKVHVEIESERLRNSLLSSISHDLRTPLAAITGAVSSLLEDETMLDAPARHELAQVAYEEAVRLNRLLGNLLEMTRLEAGSIEAKKEWQPLDEVIGTVLSRLSPQMGRRPITVQIPEDLPPVPLDDSLIGQVIINLLENALKYTPPGSPITLAASAQPSEILVEVADRGPGLPEGDELRIFDKFYRARPATASGVGLGLTICAGIIKVHGGRIWAENRPGGGARFCFTLPLDSSLPEIETKND